MGAQPRVSAVGCPLQAVVTARIRCAEQNRNTISQIRPATQIICFLFNHIFQTNYSRNCHASQISRSLSHPRNFGKNEPLLFMINGNVMLLKSAILRFIFLSRLLFMNLNSTSPDRSTPIWNLRFILSCFVVAGGNAPLHGRLTARSRG
jgi:hypothetical protein